MAQAKDFPRLEPKNTLSHSAAETYGALLPPMVNATLNLPMVLQAPVTQASLAVALYWQVGASMKAKPS